MVKHLKFNFKVFGSIPNLFTMQFNKQSKSNVLEGFSKPFSSNVLKDSSFMASFVTKTIRWNRNYLLSFLDNK